MSTTDPRIRQFFHHVRAAADLLEQILLSNSHLREKQKDEPLKDARASIATLDQSEQRSALPSVPAKLAYSVEEVRKIVGISRGGLYNAIGAKELRAVKQGRRTLVLAADLRSWREHLPSAANPKDASRK